MSILITYPGSGGQASWGQDKLEVQYKLEVQQDKLRTEQAGGTGEGKHFVRLDSRNGCCHRQQKM